MRSEPSAAAKSTSSGRCSSSEVYQDNVGIVPHSVEYDLFAVRRNIEALYLEIRLQLRKLALLAAFQVYPVEVLGGRPPPF
jgi:hypothetical protein